MNESFVIEMEGHNESFVQNDAANALLNMKNNVQQQPNLPVIMEPMQQLSQAMAALMESNRVM